MVIRILVLFIMLISANCNTTTNSKEPLRTDTSTRVKGIYGSPLPFWNNGLKLDSLGVNAIFVRGSSISREIIKRAKIENLEVFVEFPTLNGKGYVKEYPDAWAINDEGNKIQPADWFLGVCPTNEKFQEYRLNQLRDLLRNYDIEGVWMDYFHWHAQFEHPEPILVETCFCDDCLAGFGNSIDTEIKGKGTSGKASWILENKDSEWRKWRADILASWAKMFKEEIKKVNQEIKLGLFHCPWEDEAFKNARYKILGLDYKALNPYIDVYSPMVYHGRMGKPLDWVMNNTKWMKTQISEQHQIWPIIQAYDDPVVSPEDFRKVLNYAFEGGAEGVMMFTATAVARDSAKVKVMGEVFRN